VPLNVVERTLVPMSRCHSKALQKKAGIICMKMESLVPCFTSQDCIQWMDPILSFGTKYLVSDYNNWNAWFYCVRGLGIKVVISHVAHFFKEIQL
jgi:hypothetical protein